MERTRNEISGGIQNGPVYQGRHFTLQLPATITAALSGLPAKAPAFAGREADLESLLDAMAPRAEGAPAGEGPAVLIAAVGGLAGVGKTELAIQAAHTALSRGWFPGGVLFVDLFGYDPARSVDPAQALDGWLRALGIPGEHIPPELQDRSRLYASVLATYAQEGRRILVVIDNASTADQTRPLFPSDGITTTIITSRDSLASLPVRLLDLNVLPVPDAVELLDQALRVRRQGDSRIADAPADAASVAELCGRLPLALTIVAALLAENPVRSLSSMANDLADTGSRLEELNGVQAAFELSYQLLNPALARLFRLLPVNPGPDISTEAAAALTSMSPTETRRGLEALARAHLIDHGATEGRWRMHDLVRIYADTHPSTSSAERIQALTRLMHHYQDTTHAATQHLSSAAPPESTQFSDRDEALAWLDTEYFNLTAAVHTATTHPEYLTFACDLPLALGEFFNWRRYFEGWITIATVALDAARALHDQHREANALGDLGNALRGVRSFNEAITAYHAAMHIFHNMGLLQSEVMTLNNLGSALLGVRRFGEAISAYQTAAVKSHDLGGRRGEALALNNLGIALREVRRYDEAIAAHQIAAQTYSDINDPHSQAGALNNLGSAMRQVQRYGDAITAHRTAAQIYYDTNDPHSQAGALNNLGNAFSELQRYGDAITAHRTAIQIYSDTNDPHSQAGALNNLGNDLRLVGLHDEAITAHQTAIQIYRDTRDRHSEAMALGNLGLALRKVKRFDEAIDGYQAAAQIFHETNDQHSEGIALDMLEQARQAASGESDAT